MQRVQLIANQLTKNNTASNFEAVKLAPPDAIFGIAAAYKADQDPKKVDVCVGAYRDNDGKPYIFQCVRDAQQEIGDDPSINKEYLPIDGHQGFKLVARDLLFGEDNAAIKEERIATVQTLSGTGSLRVGMTFIQKHIGSEVLISKPTWANHQNIIKESGLKVGFYPYWDANTKGLNYKGMCETLEKANEGTVVLLHACAHNPTGVDPTEEQWRGIAKICKARGLVPFFDSAYHGFASGDVAKDRKAILIFQEEGLSFAVSYSFAKNFGLYGERIGALHFCCQTKQAATNVLTQLKAIIRPMYSNPPQNGALIVFRVLSNPQSNRAWLGEVKAVSNRINDMRIALKKALIDNQTPGNWDHITNQIGMFSFTGLNSKQCELLTKKYHIYLVSSGRISMAGINTKNVQYVADAIKDAVVNVK
jgi:aspartate/tyrosine/aromatic aminotransferase